MWAGFDLELEWGNNREQTSSHTKALCLSKGSGCLAAAGPWAEVESEAGAIRVGFCRRWSCMGISNERHGWMRRVRGVSSSPAAWPSPLRLFYHREASAELRECRGGGWAGWRAGGLRYSGVRWDTGRVRLLGLWRPLSKQCSLK